MYSPYPGTIYISALTPYTRKTYPRGPEVLNEWRITSAGPLKVLDLSCRRILTSSKGVTTTDSVAPAAAPVKMANNCVLGLCPLSVKYAPHHPVHQRYHAQSVVCSYRLHRLYISCDSSVLMKGLTLDGSLGSFQHKRRNDTPV